MAAEGRFFGASRERLALLRARREAAGLTAEESDGAAAVSRRPDPAERRLSFAQERLWFLDRFDPASGALDMPFVFTLGGRLDPAALAAALAAIAERHEVLRAVVPEVDGEPAVRVLPPGPVALPVVDASGLAGRLPDAATAPVAEAALAAAAAFARRPLDLARGPLLAAALVRRAPDDHLLVLSVHHVAADGWSMGILGRELAAFYAAARARPGRRPGAAEAGLPPLPIDYFDYAAWQRQAAAHRFGEQLDYWRERLAGAPPALGLPLDRPRRGDRRGRGDAVSAVLPASLVERLRRLGAARGASLFMVLVAGFDLLLSRWTGTTDIVVGTPVAGRTRREVEGLIGLFLNHLVLRVDLAGGPTFDALVERVRETAVGAFEHQEVPFEHLLAALEPARDPTRTPLFQVYVNMLEMPPVEAASAGLDIGTLPLPEPHAKFDLTLYLNPLERDPARPAGGLRLDLVYAADLFDRARMVEALAQLHHLLEQAAAAPERPVAAYDLLTPVARRTLPDPRAPLAGPWPGSLPDAFFARASEAPERIALAWRGGAITYGRLAAASGAVAASLAAGCGRGRRGLSGRTVVVHARRAPALAAAVLGVLRAGGAFVLLDPAHPVARNARAVETARPVATIELAGGEPLSDEIAAAVGGALRLRLDQEGFPQGEDAGSAAEPPRMAVDPEAAAYVAFTSGSTGGPKGVVGRHRSLTRFLPWMAEHFALGGDDRFVLVAGLAHDPLHRDLFTPLALGAAMAVPPDEALGEGATLGRFLAEQRVTVLHATPALGRRLTVGVHREPLPLRRVFFVGDALLRRDVAALVRAAPAAAVINLYGATETQRAVGYQPVDRVDPEGGPEVVPLGRGMPGVQLLVRAGAGRRAAGVGEVGEVLVRSEALAAGYLGDPAATAERFLPDEAGGTERLYRTGDLGRYRPDGSVEGLGRADRQVKVRGARVEPGEIEAALAEHPAVAEAAVVAVGEGEGRRLVAFVVATAGARLAAAELRAHLRRRLPEPMVPAAYEPLEALPLTPNRKLDRTALEARAGRAAEASAPEVAAGAVPDDGAPVDPDDPTTALVAAVWRELLDLPADPPPDGDFFAFGGHSLLVPRMLARLAEATGVALPVRLAFERPTPRLLGAALAAALAGADSPGASAPPPLEPLPFERRRGPLPLSFAQRRLWFLERLEPGRAVYHLPAVISLAGPLDAPALERALAALVRRHPALATRFGERDGVPEQRVLAPAPVPELPRVDLARLPTATREAAARGAARAWARRPFDLAAGRLLAALLVRREVDDHELVLSVHHLAADGWSLGILARELPRLYGAAAIGAAVDDLLPPLPLAPADHAAWQRSWLAGDALAARLEPVRRRLDPPPPPLDLPTDRPRPPVPSGRGGRVPVVLPPSLAAAVGRLARERRATPFMALAALFAAHLGRLSGADDLALGTPVAGRHDARLEGVVGLFADTLVLRADLSGAPSAAALVDRLRRTALDAFVHQEVPFEALVEALAPPRDRSRPPLFSVFFAYQELPLAGLPPVEVAGLRLAGQPLGTGGARFDLALSLAPSPAAGDGGTAGTLEYAADLFDRTTALRLAASFVAFAEAVVAAPDAPVESRPLLRRSERQQLLAEWSGRAAAPAADAPAGLADRFAAVARRWPDRVAVIADGGRAAVSYGTLAGRVETLRRELVARGVGPEVRVAVAAGRGAELPTALLAVVAAGGAYLPLDADQPPARRTLMLEDARPAVVLALPGEGSAPADDPRILPLGSALGSSTSHPPAASPGPPAPGAATAYLLYTSGSTGRPKPVAVPRGGLDAFLAAIEERLGRTRVAGATIAAATTAGFDIAALELFLPLVAGGTVVMIGRAEARDGRALANALGRSRAALFQGTPAAWRLLLEAGWRGDPELVALVGGEALPEELAARLEPRVGELWNLYGPTEATVWATAARLTDGAAGRPVVHLGRPLRGVHVHVVDRRLRPVPALVAGEVLLGGAGLARGYRGRPAATAEAFVPDPFAGEGESPAGGRLYRTGDLGRFAADGRLLFLGRVDRQLKVRGHRIEAGEVEAALVGHPAVAAAVVDARRGPDGERRLVAWLVPAGGRTPARPEIAAHLARRLPPYMIPALVVPVETLPLGPSGKVDRRALPEPRRGSAGEAARRRPPRGPLERAVAQVYREVLEVSEVAADDDFFALGGHSLLAVRLVARLERRIAVRLPVAVLFEAPTIAALAERCRAATTGEAVGGPRATEGGPRPVVLRPPTPSGPPVAPLALVHPAGGGALCYRDLAAALPDERPVLGLQAPGFEPGETPLERVEELAERHAGTLLEARRRGDLPHEGPWHLAGWSFGGRVAYETARRLAAAGERIGLLAVLDAGAVDSAESAAPDDAGRLAAALGEAFPLAAAELAALAGPEERVDRVAAIARERGLVPPGFDEADARRLLHLFATHLAAAAAYRPGPYGGRMVLLRAARGIVPPGDAAGGWAALATTVETIEVPGDHRSLVSPPHATTTAAALARTLAAAERAAEATATPPGTCR